VEKKVLAKNQINESEGDKIDKNKNIATTTKNSNNGSSSINNAGLTSNGSQNRSNNNNDNTVKEKKDKEEEKEKKEKREKRITRVTRCVTAPVLFIHADLDMIIDHHHSATLHARRRREGLASEFFTQVLFPLLLHTNTRLDSYSGQEPLLLC